MEIIQEEISFGRGDILKVVGSCFETFERSKIVSSVVVKNANVRVCLQTDCASPVDVVSIVWN